jgi:hypothetical protein
MSVFDPTEAARQATNQICVRMGKTAGGSGVTVPIYDKLATHAVGRNWANYVTHIEGISNQTDTQKWFLQEARENGAAPTIRKMVEKCAYAWCLDKPEAAPMPDWSRSQILQFARRVAARYVQGAIGEVFVAENVVSEPLAEEQDGDESRGIDLRTTHGVTYQVKTVTHFGTSDSSESEADRVFEVKTDEHGGVKGYQEV